MMKILLSFLLIYIGTGTIAQVQNFDSIQPSVEFDNIHVQKMHSDSLASTFAIWVKMKVKMHKHAYHTENVYISEGEGIFHLDGDTSHVQKGNLIVIPQNTWHGVEVTSPTPHEGNFGSISRV